MMMMIMMTIMTIWWEEEEEEEEERGEDDDDDDDEEEEEEEEEGGGGGGGGGGIFLWRSSKHNALHNSQVGYINKILTFNIKKGTRGWGVEGVNTSDKLYTTNNLGLEPEFEAYTFIS